METAVMWWFGVPFLIVFILAIKPPDWKVVDNLLALCLSIYGAFLVVKWLFSIAMNHL